MGIPSSGSGLRPYRSPYGYFPIRGYQQTTNSTFVAGHLVQLNTGTNAHRVTTASSLSTSYTGVAGEAGSSNAASGPYDGQRMIPIYEAREEIEYLGWLKEDIISTLLGEFRGFQRDSSLNIDVLSSGVASFTNRRAQITEVGSDSAASGTQQVASIGDTGGYVAFRFIPDYTVWGKQPQRIYTVQYTPGALAALAADDVAASSHADFTTNAVYLFTPSLGGSTNDLSTQYSIGAVYCDTASELRIRVVNNSNSTIGTGQSTQRGQVVMFK